MIIRKKEHMSRIEIGSEFSALSVGSTAASSPLLKCDGMLVFSGRTAIETVLKNEPTIKKAMLPSYCCDSMVTPFRKAGIEVYFYPVFYGNGLRIELTIPKNVDCLVWCNYFGFRNDMPDLSDFSTRGGVIIEDITHSLYSDNPYHEQSHYLVASVRKWEPILCGGCCVSRKGTMTVLPDREPSSAFLEQKKAAMQMKARYLDGDRTVDKETYLQLFSQSNYWLAENYSGLTIDAYSKDYLWSVKAEEHSKVRKQNAEVIYESLRDNINIRFLFEQSQMDCPLFVPVIIEKERRNAVRQKLIENQIYCPIHWPRPNADVESNLYDIELSLICDQRYNKEDMHRIASVLNEA